MAIAFTLRTSGEASTDDATTASVTVATNSLVLACLTCRDSGTVSDGAQTRYGVSGLGLTWVRGIEYWFGGNRGAALFYSMGTGATGTLTLTQTGTVLGWAYAIIEVTGVVTTGSNGADALTNTMSNGGLNNGPQPTITIAGTPAAGDVTLGFLQTQDAETGLTEDAGWTRIVQIVGTLECSLNVSYSTGQDQTPSWSGCRTDGRSWAGIGAIIKAGAGGGSTNWGRLMGNEINRLVRPIT